MYFKLNIHITHIYNYEPALYISNEFFFYVLDFNLKSDKT